MMPDFYAMTPISPTYSKNREPNPMQAQRSLTSLISPKNSSISKPEPANITSPVSEQLSSNHSDSESRSHSRSRSTVSLATDDESASESEYYSESEVVETTKLKK